VIAVGFLHAEARWLGAENRRRAARLRDVLVRFLARAIAAVFDWLLPDRLVLAIRSELQVRRRMDYEPFPILLYVDSETDRAVRLHAAQKEPETVAWVHQFFAPGDVLYDIGANVGTYSLIASKAMKDDLMVLAFEPAFANFFQLNRNILLNGCSENIIPVPLALWKRTGMQMFHHRELETGSSLHGLVTEFSDRFDPAYAQRLLTHRLDELVDRFSLPPASHLKLDVDGEEYEILLGADAVVSAPQMKSILVEVYERNANDIDSFLKIRGYELSSRHWHAGARAWNCIYARPPSGRCTAESTERDALRPQFGQQ
jgi:FkbM family methyltransferase